MLVANKQLSPAGLAWLTAAIDPWHDTIINGVEGMPDQTTGKSVVFQVVQEYEINKNTSPVPLPPGNWSCRVANNPILVTEPVRGGQYYGDIMSLEGGLSLVVPVQVNYTSAGGDFGSVAVGGTANAQGCSMPTNFTKGVIKVCGMGIEVINTTSVLHKQGLMTCARMSQPDADQVAVTYVAPIVDINAVGGKTYNLFRAAPKNLAEMALYPSFMQMEAKDGYYAPVVLKTGRWAHYPTSNGVILLEDDPTGGDVVAPIACFSSSVTPFAITTVPPTAVTGLLSARKNPIFNATDTNVVMFTGLSDETTLNLRVRWICERFPSDAESEMLVIATPSAPFDPMAIEIYTRLVGMLPAGVPFTENPVVSGGLNHSVRWLKSLDLWLP